MSPPSSYDPRRSFLTRPSANDGEASSSAYTKEDNISSRIELGKLVETGIWPFAAEDQNASGFWRRAIQDRPGADRGLSAYVCSLHGSSMRKLKCPCGLDPSSADLGMGSI